MSEDNKDVRDVRARRGAREKNSFDELAIGLASGTLTRFQVLKLLGGAILGAMLVPLLPGWASADHSDEDGCEGLSEPCGSTCCGVAEECCDGVVCCRAAEDCCAGACCEAGKVCVGGYCVCAPGTTECGSDCCDPATEICGEDGRCYNPFCESCQAEGGRCCQLVEGGYLISEACCYPGERSCTRSGEGCICCPAGTRCPDRDLGEAFVCISQ